MWICDSVGVLWAITLMQWLASKYISSYFRGYGIDRFSNQIKMLKSPDLSTQFKTRSQKQEESHGVS